MVEGRYLFTSESVTEGHPDKVADQISDGVLDYVLSEDPMARVACETLVTTGMALVAGEITTKCHIDYQKIVRETVQAIGYTDASFGFDYKTCAVMSAVDTQSPDIAMGVDTGGAQHHLDRSQVSAAVQQMGCEGMPQRVGRYRFLNARLISVILQNLPEVVSGQRDAIPFQK